MTFSTTTKQILTVASIAALSLLGAGSAFAQEATPDTWLQTTQSTKSRADVRTELAGARQSGATQSWSNGYIDPVRSQALRAEVKAQTVQAIQSGEARSINAEVYSYTPATVQRLSQLGK